MLALTVSQTTFMQSFIKICPLIEEKIGNIQSFIDKIRSLQFGDDVQFPHIHTLLWNLLNHKLVHLRGSCTDDISPKITNLLVLILAKRCFFSFRDFLSSPHPVYRSSTKLQLLLLGFSLLTRDLAGRNLLQLSQCGDCDHRSQYRLY